MAENRLESIIVVSRTTTTFDGETMVDKVYKCGTCGGRVTVRGFGGWFYYCQKCGRSAPIGTVEIV